MVVVAVDDDVTMIGIGDVVVVVVAVVVFVAGHFGIAALANSHHGNSTTSQTFRSICNRYLRGEIESTGIGCLLKKGRLIVVSSVVIKFLRVRKSL